MYVVKAAAAAAAGSGVIIMMLLLLQLAAKRRPRCVVADAFSEHSLHLRCCLTTDGELFSACSSLQCFSSLHWLCVHDCVDVSVHFTGFVCMIVSVFQFISLALCA